MGLYTHRDGREWDLDRHRRWATDHCQCMLDLDSARPIQDTVHQDLVHRAGMVVQAIQGCM